MYAPGSFSHGEGEIGTRHVLLGIRTFIDPANPNEVKQVHVLQDAIKVEQKSSGSFDAPNWDHVSQEKVRDALTMLEPWFAGLHST